MPFVKYTGQPLTTVVRDEPYYRWFKGTVYARMNPELAADLAAIASTVPTTDCAPVSVEAEFAPGGCVVYRPAIWCRSPEPRD